MAEVSCNVVLDTSAAEAALAFLRDTRHETASEGLQRRWAALLNTPAYQAWFRCCGISGEARAALRWCLPVSGPLWPELPRPLCGLLAAFSEGRERIEELSLRLIQAQQLPAAEAARRALAFLPPGTDLRATVFVLLAGDRQGMANDDGQVTIDLLSIPLGPAGEYMTSLLAHELHHIGVNRWLERDQALQAALAAGGPRAAVGLMLCMLLIEGTANAFFTPCDVTWMRSHGPALAETGVDETALCEFENSVYEGKKRLPGLLREIDNTLASLLAGTSDPAALEYPHHMTEPREGLPRPIAHFVGEAMVNAIRWHGGDDPVVAAIRDWRRFLPAYQTAATEAGLPTLRGETIARLAAFLGQE